MDHILVASQGWDAARTLGVEVDSTGRSCHALPTWDALATCAALQDAGFPAALAAPSAEWAHDLWSESLAQNPESARLVLAWHTAHGAATDRARPGLLMSAMRALWPNAIAALAAFVDQHADTYSFADTFRVAPDDDATARTAYDLVRRSGCCGSADITLDVDGRRFLAGFHHGH